LGLLNFCATSVSWNSKEMGNNVSVSCSVPVGVERGGLWSVPSRNVCSKIKCNIPEDFKLDVSILNADRWIRHRNLANLCVLCSAVNRSRTETDRQTDMSIFIEENRIKGSTSLCVNWSTR
jgi:hypothetical protein